MKRFLLSSLMVGACALLFASVVNAQPQQRQMMMHRGAQGPMGMLQMDELNLTDEQKTQVQQIFLDVRKKNIDIEAKQKLGRIELGELTMADTPDQKKIDAKVAELGQLHASKMSTHINAMLAVQKILTPEQRKKAKELRLFNHFGPYGFGDGPMHRGAGRFGRFPRFMQMDNDEE